MTTPTHDDLRDELVTETYRDVAVEKTPEALDRAVLDTAGRQAQGSKASPWRFAGYRPVALAATIGLSLALVLELSRMTALESPPLDDVPPVPADIFEAAGEQTAAEIDRLGTGMSPSAPPVSMETPAVATDTEPTLLPAEAQCSEDDRATPSQWWACIEDLEQRGLTTSAERELRALLQSYPTFTIPQ
jgi:hypothetical protein